MKPGENVFEETYMYYLSRLRELSFESLADNLGAELKGGNLKIPLFRNQYEISRDEIIDPSGKRPPHDICVILSKYILLCPPALPPEDDWVNFRDLKDSGPLTSYFANDVEGAIEKYFSAGFGELKKAGHALGGYPPNLDIDYDLAMQFDALPRVPLLMLYNDADEEFPAKCFVLFKSGVEKFLDSECIAMLGWQLFNHLNKSIHPGNPV
ncbi:MAG: DUF3786 domain-containing protein [Desulfobacteraceae bacterium]|nr:DUF3786 domain-containing protein [Desulfobacteraceae bacterium]MCF8094349.1 DUF3786 domain-containing protein [Desulfobacteraceae bacterium]